MSKPWMVFVLGAGASRDAGLPLYFELLSPDLGNRLLQKIDTRPDLKSIFEKWILELIDQANRWRAFGNDLECLLDEFYQSDIEKYRDLTSFYKRAIRLSDAVYQSNQIPLYLIEGIPAIVELIAKAGARAAFLSFNHDLLIEHALCGPYSHAFSYFLSPTHAASYSDIYCNGIRMVGGLSLDGVIGRFTDSQSSIPLLKLHGSFNWLYCRRCDFIVVAGDDVEGDGSRCPRCHDMLLEVGIVPPKRAKERYAFTGIWEIAKQILNNAQAVSFVGYSLPEYDQDAYDLFQRSVPANILVQIISPVHTENSRRRFSDLFVKQQVQFLESGFETCIWEWVRHPSQRG